jgi:hypothetical protein
VLVCSFHHHLVHEGDWFVVRTEDGELSFIAVYGHALPAAPSRESSEDSLAFIHEWAEDRGLDLGADTMPLSDGTRPDYDWAVAALVSDAAV